MTEPTTPSAIRIVADELKRMWKWADTQDQGTQVAVAILFLVYGIVAFLVLASLVTLVALAVAAVWP